MAILTILSPSFTEKYGNLTKYTYMFMVGGNIYSFNTLSTNNNNLDAYISLKDFFETFMDFAENWIELNNKCSDIINKFMRMSKLPIAEKNEYIYSTVAVKKLDNEIYENFDILSNLLNMYANFYYDNFNMLHIVKIIKYLKSMNVSEFIPIQYYATY